MALTVPIVDLKPYIDGTDPDTVIKKVDEACRNSGFLVIRGHGIPQALQEKTAETGREFFARPAAAKSQHTVKPDRGGYQKFANMSLAQSYNLEKAAPADLREGYSFDRVHLEQPESTIWGGAAADAAMRVTLSEYFTALNRLSDTLHEIFALALGREKDHFVPLNDHNASTLALYHYPPMERPPLPGQLRGGAHTDFGSLTILFGEPSVRGLQVYDGSKWEDAPIEPDTFVVNIGDLMMRWTNDKYRSTLHRVANPVDGQWDQTRFSFVFFHTPNEDALISSLDRDNAAKYPDILSGEYFHERITAMADL
jgi:isopenicillin N synthase-like dioxygenase